MGTPERPQKGLEGLSELISSTAGKAPEGALLRLHREVELKDPWLLLPLLREREGLVAAWESADGELSFVAGGRAWGEALAGAKRFETSSERLAQLMANAVEISADPELGRRVPMMLSGFAFAPGAAAGPDWEGWGDGRLWVPGWIACRVGERSFLVVARLLEQAGELPSALQELEGMLAEQPGEVEAFKVGISAENDQPAVNGADSSSGWEGWSARVGEAHEALRQGGVEKVVLARRTDFTINEGRFDPLATAVAMRAQQPNCTTFVVRRGKGQAFVGATPEDLVRVEGDEVTSMSLAGTRRRGDGELRRELQGSAKDNQEQRFVTEAIAEALRPVVTDLEFPDEPAVAALADLQHLKTPIRGRRREGVGIFELADRLHPSPAVGGLPRREALDWISRHEGIDRGWYAGPIGWVGCDGDGLLVIAIRSVLIDHNRAAAFVGCGLVAESDARSEWDESRVKLTPATRGLSWS